MLVMLLIYVFIALIFLMPAVDLSFPVINALANFILIVFPLTMIMSVGCMFVQII